MPTPYRILSDDTLNLLAERGNAQALMELGYRAERLGILAEAQELARRLREGSKEMSDCKHCDHLTAFWKDAAGEHERWQCCHCGRIRECSKAHLTCNRCQRAVDYEPDVLDRAFDPEIPASTQGDEGG